jgi:predicted permease
LLLNLWLLVGGRLAMKWLIRLRDLFSRFDGDLDEELLSHISRHTEDLERSGLSRHEAERRARIAFGSLEKAKESVREQRPGFLLETFWRDMVYAFRQLRRSLGFTAVAIFTLALGIGGTTAVFSALDAVLFHGLPYRDPAQLIELATRNPQGETNSLSAAEFADYQTQTQSFEDVAAYDRWKFLVLTGIGDPDEVWSSRVSNNLFHLLGVKAVAGRTFAAEETHVAILSSEYWRNHFAADWGVIGKTIALDGEPYTVIGIAPANFEFPDPNTQVWLPLVFADAEKNDRGKRDFEVIGRLKPGAALSQAQAAIDLVSSRLAMQYPKTNAGWTATIQSYKAPETSSPLRSAIFALLAAVVFVLLIACSNVTSMLLARGASRSAEMAVRSALGAGRARLIRQLLVESVLLSGAACVLGLLLAYTGLAMTGALLPKYTLVESQSLRHIPIHLPILGFTVVFSLFTGIAVSLVPALRVSKPDLVDSLNQGGRTFGLGARKSGLQRALIVVEVALALVLLVGAGLMVQSFQRFAKTPTGFHPDHLLTVRIPLVQYKYAQGPRSAAFYQSVLERIRAIPGVSSAGMVNDLPFTGFGTSVSFPAPLNSHDPSDGQMIAANAISPGYFQSMGIPIKAGRDFSQADNLQGAPCVRIVNESMAHLYWPGENPIGKQVLRACVADATAQIVGVVGDSSHAALGVAPVPELYIPYSQQPFASFLITFTVRTSGDPLTIIPAVRDAVSSIDRDQPIIQVRTMENVISESIWQERISASMLALFAGIALILSAVGIYGVFSYSVSQRTHEIGIRAALGATRADILRMVVREGLLLTLIGLSGGILAALWLTRLLGSLLYGITPRDPATFVALSLLLTTVALFACAIPARRATRIGPMDALRHE